MLKHCGTIDIQTERLLLRKFKKSDVEDMFCNWTSDERVAKYTTWFAHASIDDSRMFLEYILSQDKISDYNWAIQLGDKVIGSINVCYSDDNLEICGIAYSLSYTYWGKGYMTEAAKAVVDFLFNKVNYRKIIAGCDSANIGSSKVLEHIGMKCEACLRGQLKRKDGSFGDDLQYGLFKDEFRR